VVENEQIVNVSGKNLLKGIEEGDISDATGEDTNSTEYWRSVDYIKIPSNKTIYASLNNSMSFLTKNLRVYNKNKQYIGYLNNDTSSPFYNNATTITKVTSVADDTPAYIRFTTEKANLESASAKFMLFQATSGGLQPVIDTTYEPYIESNYTIGLKSKNLFNYTNISINGDGTVSKDDEKITITWSGGINVDLSDMVNNLDSSKTYTISFKHKGDSLILRDKIQNTDLKKIGVHEDYTLFNYNITNKTAFQIRFVRDYGTNNTGTAYIKDIQIEEGNQPTSYEPYYNYKLCKIDTYKDSIKKSTGKNLFDKNSQNFKQYYILNENGEETQSNASQYSLNFTKVKPNTTYTIQGKLCSSMNVTRIYEYDENKNWIKRGNGIGISSLPYTFTTNNNTYYLKFQTEIAAYDGNTVQLEENSTATDYEPYGTDWYVKKEISKVVLNGSESWNMPSSTNYFYYNNSQFPMSSDGSSIYPMYSTYFISNKFDLLYNGTIDYGIAFAYNVNRMAIRNKDITTAEDFKTWLSTHNTIVYYVLDTPTYEKITNETLISQLESIEAITGLNYFSVSNDNNVLPTLYVSRLKELDSLT
ncbi:MAG: hypothetical protein VZR33_08335, partial [Methanosphaera sp.]|nr:hypothetical protein [Methanosphaera sp.]